MKTKKSTAFWLSIVSLMVMYVITLFRDPAVLESVAGSIVWGIVAAAGLFQGANVADNGVKGKFYRPELDKNEGKGK